MLILNASFLLSIASLPCILSFSVNCPTIGDCKPMFGNSLRSSVTLSEKAQNTEIDLLVESIGVIDGSNKMLVPRPKIHYTVPGFKVGWRDENGNWFDEDGPRNGPPQNYWRQMSDELEYNRDMDALSNVLAEFDVEETVRNLEERRSVRFPSLHRKLLGKWASILLSDERVTSNDAPVDDEISIDVPYTMDIARTNGRKYAPKNHYGIFDLKLSNGEQLTAK